MRVVVIGGTGHIGTYLVPRLVEAGHDVIVVTRQTREPYQPHTAWSAVQRVTLDRTAQEAAAPRGGRAPAKAHALRGIYKPQFPATISASLRGQRLCVWSSSAGPDISEPIWCRAWSRRGTTSSW